MNTGLHGRAERLHRLSLSLFASVDDLSLLLFLTLGKKKSNFLLCVCTRLAFFVLGCSTVGVTDYEQHGDTEKKQFYKLYATPATHDDAEARCQVGQNILTMGVDVRVPNQYCYGQFSAAIKKQLLMDIVLSPGWVCA